ncbi:MAG: hypothetical protein V9E91_14115, partial [Burkholderiaceae bacterium]
SRLRSGGAAAANQLLEQHREAVRWYETIIKAKADDLDAAHCRCIAPHQSCWYGGSGTSARLALIKRAPPQSRRCTAPA